MTPSETLSTWRAEIAAELDQLEGEMTSARDEFEAADRAYRAEAARWSAISATAARGLGRIDGAVEGMACPLYDRVECGRDEALRPLSLARGRANARAKGIESSIAGRRLALRQIDDALSADRVTPLRPEVAKRPKARPIDFDTIITPREVG